jgi:hypothetical protein
LIRPQLVSGLGGGTDVGTDASRVNVSKKNVVGASESLLAEI